MKNLLEIRIFSVTRINSGYLQTLGMSISSVKPTSHKARMKVSYLHKSKSNISHGHCTAQAFVSKPWCQRTLFKLPCIAVSCTRKLVAWHNIISTNNHREQDATGIWTVSCPSCKLRSLHCHAKSSSRYTDIQMDSEFASRICLFNHQHGELHCSSACSSG